MEIAKLEGRRLSRRPFWACVKESGQWRVGRILIRTPAQVSVHFYGYGILTEGLRGRLP